MISQPDFEERLCLPLEPETVMMIMTGLEESDRIRRSHKIDRSSEHAGCLIIIRIMIVIFVAMTIIIIFFLIISKLPECQQLSVCFFDSIGCAQASWTL